MKSITIHDDMGIKWSHDGKDYCLHIHGEDWADNPIKHEDTIRFAIWHQKYDLGNQPTDIQNPLEYWEELANHVLRNPVPQDRIPGYQELLQDHAVWMDLWLHDHSGLSIHCGHKNPYADSFDSGFIGWAIIVTDEFYGTQVPPDWKHACETIITDTVQTYNDYLAGETYSFELMERQDDGTWSSDTNSAVYYGDDLTENGILDALRDQKPEAARGLERAVRERTVEKGTLSSATVTVYDYDYLTDK